MNKQLAISIPTYNRTEILKSNLVSIINQAKRFNIPIYISDDSDNNRTHEMIKSYIQDYQFLFDKGAVAVFGPGTKISEAAIKILEILIQ